MASLRHRFATFLKTKGLTAMLLCWALSVQNVFAQVNGSTLETFNLRRHYFSFDLGAATFDGLKGGFSLGYYHRIHKNNKHFLGLRFTGYPSKRSRSMNGYYQGTPISDGSTEVNLSVISMDLNYNYFFHPDQQSSPFMFLDVGSKSIQNYFNTSFRYNSGFPFGWVPGGDYVELNNQTRLSFTLGGGYWFNFFKNRGFYFRTGITYTESFSIVDISSIGYDANGVQYKTSLSNSIYLSFGTGMLF